MALPKIATPKHRLKLHSGKDISFRPFLVKEEKLLLLAMESEDETNIVDTITQVVSSCTGLSEAEVTKLSTFDIELLFLNIRAKSVGESVDVKVTCSDDGTTEVPLSIPLDKIKLTTSPNHDMNIMLTETVGCLMKYPAMDTFVKVNFSGDSPSVDQIFELAGSCIDKIYEGEQIHDASDSTKEELQEFLGQLNSEQFGKFQTFFETMPKLSYKTKVTNPNTGKKVDVVLEGLASFFG